MFRGTVSENQESMRPPVCSYHNKAMYKDRKILPFMSEAQCWQREIKMRTHRYLTVHAGSRIDRSIYVDANGRIGCASLGPLFFLVNDRRTPHADAESSRREISDNNLTDDGLHSIDFAAFTYLRSFGDEAGYVRKLLLGKRSYQAHLRRLNISFDPHFGKKLAPVFRRQLCGARSGRLPTNDFDRALIHSSRRYASECYPNCDSASHMIVYTKMVLRAQNARTATLNELWWREFADGVPRDQLSIMYCLGIVRRRLGLRWLSLNNVSNSKHQWLVKLYRRKAYEAPSTKEAL
mmetsp:Transcript_37790/g.62559  ORF Transcript_37790/g.62559 Transcript_37790/m.62559 type:complete len:293 (+) Transcript_37790:2-880(+)